MALSIQQKSRQYSRISFQTRKELIRLVVDQKLTIKESCEKLQINYSTGKLTVKKFQKEGRITRFADEMCQEQRKTNRLEKQQKKEKKQSIKQNVKQIDIQQETNLKNTFSPFAQYGCEFYYQPMMFQSENLMDFGAMPYQPYTIFYWSN